MNELSRAELLSNNDNDNDSDDDDDDDNADVWV